MSILDLPGDFPESDGVRMTVTFSPETYRKIKRLAARRGTSMANVLRDAVALEDFFQSAVDEGSKVMLEKGGRARQVQVIR